MNILAAIKSIFGSKDAAQQSDPATKTGFVKFFDRSKGYGFIQEADSPNSVFVHISDLRSQVRAGDRVSYQVAQDPKGPKAINVERLSKKQ